MVRRSTEPAPSRASGFASFSGLNTNQQNVANALTNFFNTNNGIPGQFVGLTSSGARWVAR
jgi:hypothetical protein